MIKKGNKRIMITLSQEDIDQLEKLCTSLNFSKTQVIHYLLTGELIKNLYCSGYSLEISKEV